MLFKNVDLAAKHSSHLRDLFVVLVIKQFNFLAVVCALARFNLFEV